MSPLFESNWWVIWLATYLQDAISKGGKTRERRDDCTQRKVSFCFHATFWKGRRLNSEDSDSWAGGVAKIPIIGCFALAIYPWKISSVPASSTSWLIRLNGNFGVLDISSAKFVENVKHSSGSCFFNQLIDTTVRIHYTLFTKISFLKKHSNLRWPSLQDKLF